jgi:thiol-disulfide isomerase/thioredoxin
MKNIVLTIILLFAMKVNAQDLNKKIEDTIKHKQVLINQCNRAGLTSFPEFKESYDFNYGYYKVDTNSVKILSKLTKDKTIKVILGTWCEDSKFQVPNFIKLLDALKISEDQVKFIAVDGNKKVEDGSIDKLKIEKVPTFIIGDKMGNEIGRITESPKETLEKEDAHYDNEMDLQLGWVVEAIDEAISRLDALIEYNAESKEAQKNYNEMIIEQNAINMGMNRL